MPRRPGRNSKSEPRWSLAEPPPGLFPGGEDLLRLLAVLAIAAAVAAACSFLNRRQSTFCDSDADPYAAAYDSCEPCPENGRCADGELECVQGFRRRGNRCVEDGLLTQTANKIAESLQRRICDEHARALCAWWRKPHFISTYNQLEISNMADELLSNHPARLTDDGIRVVKDRVLQSAHAFFETILTDNKAESFKCPDLVAELHRPLDCQVRQWISTNIVFLMAFCILFAALLRILWSVYKRRALSKRAEQIYDQVCEILEDNAINAKIGNSGCEPWVVTSWLRDHLLVTRERRNALLWKKVEELILEDSRIDQYPKVVKGESKVVLERPFSVPLCFGCCGALASSIEQNVGCVTAAGGSLSGKKKMRDSAGKTRSGSVGAIKLAEEICGSSSSSSSITDKEQVSARREGTNANFM